jgi:uncharacterized membrane-anchored protein YitT (DUF2179 family)
VLIISKQWLQIADEILKDIRRGVTVIEGRGGYSGKKEHILYAVSPSGKSESSSDLFSILIRRPLS